MCIAACDFVIRMISTGRQASPKFQCAPFVPNAGMHWRCPACGVRVGAIAMAVFRCMAHERCGRGWPNRDGAPQTGGHVGGRGCLIRWTPGRMRRGEVGQGARGRLPGIHDVEAEWRGFVAPPGSGAAIGRVRGAARLPIATCRRRRSTPVPGGASSRAPIDDRGAVRPSGPAPIYSGLAASASNRPSIYSRAAVAAVGGDRHRVAGRAMDVHQVRVVERREHVAVRDEERAVEPFDQA